MYDVYDRISALVMGQTVYVDYQDTLWLEAAQEPNMPLIEALKAAQARGVRVHLWTHEPFAETVRRVEVMKRYGLEFADVHCGVYKPDLLIDNLAVSP